MQKLSVGWKLGSSLLYHGYSRYCSNITECGFSASAVWNLLPVTQLESSALIIMALI